MANNLPVLEKLGKSIIRLLGCNPSSLTLQGTNTYILGNDKELIKTKFYRRRTLVDTGDGKSDDYLRYLIDTMKNEKFTINKIIITHWHLDHTGGIKRILRNIPIYKFPEKNIDKQYGFDFLPLNQHEILEINGVGNIKVHHTPGHSNDEIALELLDQNSVICGDTILGYGTTIFINLKQYLNSLYLLKNLNTSILYPGHGPHLCNPNQSINSYIKHRRDREKQVFPFD
ncbi:hypothetical protein HZS_933 [Henneguya salminicola]|nr:hypothetical protein HZS_933 [Henneguya salminicola]